MITSLMVKRLSSALGLVLLAAASLGAQQPPGFTTYVLAFLMQPPSGPASTMELDRAQAAHLDAMRKDGLLLAAGAVDDGSELKALLVLNGADPALVEQRLASAPLVKAGVLQTAAGPWVAPTGIGDPTRTAANAPSPMRTYQVVLFKVSLGARMMPDEQRGLLQQMDAMAKAGQLAAAGPVLEGSDLAWVFVFSAGAEETDALVAANLAVKAGKMTTERHAWRVPEGTIPPGFKVPGQ